MITIHSNLHLPHLARAGRLLALGFLLALVATGGVGRLGTASVQAQTDRGEATPGLPGVGDPVAFPAGAASEADAAGEITVTVTQVVDPFGAFGSGTPPPGSRFVYVGLLIANGTDAPLTVDPATLFVVDTDGYAYRPSDRFGGTALAEGSDADATADTDAADADTAQSSQAGEMVEPGTEVTGGAVFAVAEAAVLAAVYHDPAPDRLILLAVLGGDGDGQDEADGGDGADGADGADGQDGADGEDGEDGEDGANGGDGGDGGDGGAAVVVPDDVDCDAYAPYYEDLDARLTALNDAVSGFNDLITSVASDPAGAGVTIATAAADIADLADEQAEADVPPGLEDLNDQAVEMFGAFAVALENLASGLSSFDVTAIQSVSAEIEAAGAQNETVVGIVNALAEGCGLET